jgi:hypothetical protein
MANGHSFTFDSDKAMDVLGVPGRLTHRTTKPGSDETGARWFKQRWISEARPIAGYGVAGAVIRAELRFDDELGNGHNSFAITGTVTTRLRETRGNDILAGGCLHDDIAKVFPELAPLIQWHLTSSDGPMHYIANTLYHAGNRDYNGHVAGQPSRFDDVIRFDDVPILHKVQKGLLSFLREVMAYDPAGQAAALVPIAVAYDGKSDGYAFAPKYQFAGQPPLRWHECAFDDEGQAERFAAAVMGNNPRLERVPTAYSEGKERNLDAARRTANWPDATDAELSAEPAELRAALEARAPALTAAFRAAMESAGFVWAPSDFPASIDA